jgi:hypothetical protein
MIIIWLLAYRMQRGPGLGQQQFAAAFLLNSSATTYTVKIGFKQKYTLFIWVLYQIYIFAYSEIKVKRV